ncbi:MAG TPA: hypothetical protein VGS08_01550 [Candidatus Saccharimonadales bacterium]|nr:hypothetical protein [Candidatus Saccharimonadales bacterium]
MSCDKQLVSQHRDSLLSNYAASSAKAGDFAKAHLFLASIGGELSQAYAVKKCLSYATRLDQLDSIKPDEMTLMFNPDLSMQFRVAEALIEGDPDKLSDLALELAGTIDKALSPIAYMNIERMYLAVVQKRDGVELARNLLAALRRTGAMRHDMQVYSEDLIRAGDTDEPSRAYKDTDRNSVDSSWRLGAMWQLSHLLDDNDDFSNT